MCYKRRQEWECFKEIVANCVGCCQELKNGQDRKMSIGFSVMEIVGDLEKTCFILTGEMMTKAELKLFQEWSEKMKTMNLVFRGDFCMLS